MQAVHGLHPTGSLRLSCFVADKTVTRHFAQATRSTFSLTLSLCLALRARFARLILLQAKCSSPAIGTIFLLSFLGCGNPAHHISITGTAPELVI
jgi:hypothetical protein